MSLCQLSNELTKLLTSITEIDKPVVTGATWRKQYDLSRLRVFPGFGERIMGATREDNFRPRQTACFVQSVHE